MNPDRKLLLMWLLVSLAAVLPLCSAEPFPKDKRSPEYDGTLVLSGLGDTVTVIRDERGMPHIYASDEHDLYYATGFVSAQERLWQMDIIRRASSGRLAEIFGKKYLQADIFARALRIRSTAEELVRQLDPVLIASLQAYADGVNFFIDASVHNLPLEFLLLGYAPDPWTLADIAGIVGLMGWSLDSRNLSMELFLYQVLTMLGREVAAEIAPDWSESENAAYPDFILNDTLISRARTMADAFSGISTLGVPSFSGSNNWAVDGSRTETGMPLLSNDIHLTLGCPGVWMQMHQVIPGELNVTGVMIPGSPLIIAGHNEDIAWGMTNLRVDAVDLYAETLNPVNTRQYLCDDEWRDMTSVYEVFSVRGEKDDTLEILFTHRGPVITALPWPYPKTGSMEMLGYDCLPGLKQMEGTALSMRWTGTEPSDEITGISKLNSAECWDDFREAISLFRAVSQNFVYADRNGNIGLSACGGVPLRKGGTFVHDGSTTDEDWTGFLPFELMPFTFNPADGEVSSANNRTVNGDYPWYISSTFDVPYRINRIRTMLATQERFSADDFKMMMNDQHSDYARMLTPVILRAEGECTGCSQEEKRALEQIRSWDYEMSPDMAAPTVFEYFRMSFCRRLMGDELGDLFPSLCQVTYENYVLRLLTSGDGLLVDDITTPDRETLDDIVRAAFSDGVSLMTEGLGKRPANWRWGEVHHISFSHPMSSVKILNSLFRLSSPEYAVGGSDNTVCPYFSLQPGFGVTCGASMRHIYNTADWDASWSVIPGGASGVPGSEYYLSQVTSYVSGRFYSDHFSSGAVRAAASHTLLMIP